MDPSFPAGVPIAGVMSPVREVSLRGTADLAYWAERLKKEGLTSEEAERRARMLMVFADCSFKGIRAREVSFSILVRPREGEVRGTACFLERAFNSVRFFAWVERMYFSTPYFLAKIGVDPALPASVDLRLKDGGGFAALMAAGGRTPRW